MTHEQNETLNKLYANPFFRRDEYRESECFAAADYCEEIVDSDVNDAVCELYKLQTETDDYERTLELSETEKKEWVEFIEANCDCGRNEIKNILNELNI